MPVKTPLRVKRHIVSPSRNPAGSSTSDTVSTSPGSPGRSRMRIGRRLRSMSSCASSLSNVGPERCSSSGSA